MSNHFECIFAQKHMKGEKITQDLSFNYIHTENGWDFGVGFYVDPSSNVKKVHSKYFSQEYKIYLVYQMAIVIDTYR